MLNYSQLPTLDDLPIRIQQFDAVIVEIAKAVIRVDVNEGAVGVIRERTRRIERLVHRAQMGEVGVVFGNLVRRARMVQL